MVKETKRGSSLWIKTKGSSLQDFSWQNGYGAFSVSCSQVAAVKSYIANQVDHHRRISFQDEFRELLRRHGVDFDERHVWA